MGAKPGSCRHDRTWGWGASVPVAEESMREGVSGSSLARGSWVVKDKGARAGVRPPGSDEVSVFRPATEDICVGDGTAFRSGAVGRAMSVGVRLLGQQGRMRGIGGGRRGKGWRVVGSIARQSVDWPQKWMREKRVWVTAG